ncbi:MAG TPA: hypothetical protein VFI00_02045, partial [Kribbella sp.]|nr:hypothetical protein [Kribbella sp.]
MVATAAVTAAVVLLAGCGGDDKKSDAKPEGGSQSSSSTPSAPPVASFDPPKGFAAVSAFGVPQSDKDNQYSRTSGMVGQTTLIAGKFGITGRNIAAQGQPWSVPPAETETTTVAAMTHPMPVQLDGKDVVALAYIESVAGSGTQKAKGQVLFQWIDAADGKKVAEVAADLTPLLGPGQTGDNVVSQAYDAATGQIVVGVHPDTATAKSGGIFSVFADPKTQKSSLIPSFEPAGVLNGVVAGLNGGDAGGRGETTILLADAASGKITKQFPTKQARLYGAGHGSKRAYVSGNTVVNGDKYNNVLYSIDIATGAVVPIKASIVDTGMRFSCLGDQANAVVCVQAAGSFITSNVGNSREIIGIDDTTGAKTWGYTDQAANRIIPDVTAAFHGIVYGQTDTQPVLLDAATGNDVPASAPTPSNSMTPSDASTPSDGGTPTEGATPSQDPGSLGTDPGSANGSDMSLYNHKQKSPTAVTKYGGVYT